MRLTMHTDYALRVLMALAVAGDRLMTIEDLSRRHKVSRNHLMKVAQSLVALGLVNGVRGRNGGLSLAQSASSIRMGAVVRALETDQQLVACLGDEAATCVFNGACRLTGMFGKALEAFFHELDTLTLADLVQNRSAIQARLTLAA
jgi:Rrf2 family nitric oxide-sensitive transcriptional repressor